MVLGSAGSHTMPVRLLQITPGRKPIFLTRFIPECSIYEFSSRVKELAKIEGGQIICLHPVVLDVHVPVVFWSRIDVPPAMGCVEDVGEAGFLKAVAIQGCFPGSKQSEAVKQGHCGYGIVQLAWHENLKV